MSGWWLLVGALLGALAGPLAVCSGVHGECVFCPFRQVGGQQLSAAASALTAMHARSIRSESNVLCARVGFGVGGEQVNFFDQTLLSTRIPLISSRRTRRTPSLGSFPLQGPPDARTHALMPFVRQTGRSSLKLQGRVLF